MAKGDALAVRMELRKHFYLPFPEPVEQTKALLTGGSPFPEVEKALGLSKTVFLVACMVHNFCSQFNLGPGKNMNQGQIEDFAGVLTFDFIDRKGNAVMLEELAAFFDKAPTMKRKDGRSFIFDHVDRLVIEEMLDFYFENDRTQAVWAIEDEREARKRETVQETPRLSNGQSDPTENTVKDIYTRYAGQGPKFVLAKMLTEMGEKYGENEQSPNA